MDQASFSDYINTLDVGQLRECQCLINQVVVLKTVGEVTPSHNTSDSSYSPVDVNDYVDYDADFIKDTHQMHMLQTELESFGFKTNQKSSKFVFVLMC